MKVKFRGDSKGYHSAPSGFEYLFTSSGETVKPEDEEFFRQMVRAPHSQWEIVIEPNAEPEPVSEPKAEPELIEEKKTAYMNKGGKKS